MEVEAEELVYPYCRKKVKKMRTEEHIRNMLSNAEYELFKLQQEDTLMSELEEMITRMILKNKIRVLKEVLNEKN